MQRNNLILLGLLILSGFFLTLGAYVHVAFGIAGFILVCMVVSFCIIAPAE